MTHRCNSCGWEGDELRTLEGKAPDLCPDCLSSDVTEVND